MRLSCWEIISSEVEDSKDINKLYRIEMIIFCGIQNLLPQRLSDSVTSYKYLVHYEHLNRLIMTGIFPYLKFFKQSFI